MTRMERDLESLFEAQTRSLGVGVPPTLADAQRAERSSTVGDVCVSGPAVVAHIDVDTVDTVDRVFEPLVANRGPWWPVVTVAAAVVLTVSLLVVSIRDDGQRAPAARPPVTGTLPLPDRVGDATAFWEAVVAGDRSTALGFVGPTPVGEEPLKLFGRAETLERQFDWYEAVGWQWTLEGCMKDDVVPTDVQCEATAKNAWSEALGADPVTGAFVMHLDDDGFLTIVTDSFSARWVGRVFKPFEVWVRANHPDDAEVMWGDGEIDEVVLELYEVNTERFVTAQLDERTTTAIPNQEEP